MRFTGKHAATLLVAAGVIAAAAPRQAHGETLFVTAARMIDARAGRVIDEPAIIIEGERIVRVGTRSRLSAPVGARSLALEGMTLLPGLIDMHVHLTVRHDMHGYRRLGISVPRQAVDGVLHAERTLRAGFTGARNVHASGFADVAVRDAINEGRALGPRLWVSGPSIGATGGHSDNNLLSQFGYRAESVADGPWAIVEKVRIARKQGADVIKLATTGGVITKGTSFDTQELSREEIAAAVDEAHRLGMKVAAHAHGASGIKAAILAGVDTVEHASFIDDEGIELAKRHGTYLTMDIYNTEYILNQGEAAGYLPETLAKERIVGGAQRAAFTKAVKAGVPMLFGTDAGLFPHGQNAVLFSRLVQFGMTPMQAIQSATVSAAKALGAEKDIGAIEQGRYADIIAIRGDPLANISVLENVQFVMKGGAVVKDQR